jgi:formylglycine-generating enzyme
MVRPISKSPRLGLGRLQAVACVVLSASVGIAAGAVRPKERARGDASPGERRPSPRQEIYPPAREVPSCTNESLQDEATVLVPAGTHRSFFKRDGKAAETQVVPFLLDRLPVTRAAFAAFVLENPAWRRSRVKRIFAEQAYLGDFRSDIDEGSEADAPVTFVSWFAARAYCACRGKRLPTLAEWELSASPKSPADGVAPSRGRGGRLSFAMGRASNEPGDAEFGFVWEWTEDFDGAPVSSRTSDAADSNLFCGAGVRAADAADYGGFLRYSFRSSLRAHYALKNLGFRCAKDAP